MPDEVGSSDSETVEEGFGGADEEGNGDARQAGPERVATAGDIVGKNGPALTGRMENEITEVVVLLGRTEAMQTDDGGRDGVPRGLEQGDGEIDSKTWGGLDWRRASYLYYGVLLRSYS